jgi:hypothetical protein
VEILYFAAILVVSHAAVFGLGMKFKATVLAEKEALKAQADTFIHKL